MCAGETYNPNGRHASLVIYVRGNTQPGETHITMTPATEKSHSYRATHTYTVLKTFNGSVRIINLLSMVSIPVHLTVYLERRAVVESN